LKRYRILYHHRIRADDGQAVHVRELVAALRAEGHEVRECALVPKTQGEARADGASQGGVWRHLRLPRRAVELMEIAYTRQGARMLERAAAEFRPDVIYERHALHCAAGLRAARRARVPLLLEVNSPMCDEMERLGLLRFARRARRTERAVLAGADRVLAVTGVLRRRLIECGADAGRTLVIGNGAEPSRYGDEARAAGRALRRGLPEGAFVLGFVGYMRPWHRLDLALEAMQRPSLQRVHLMLVGEGPALPALRERATALRMYERFHTMGVVPSEQLAAHVCAFDAALIPAINDYASPLKLFESLAAGIVTIAPDQENLRELVRDGVDGVLFAPGDAAALADKLEGIVADSGRGRAIGAAGLRTLVERDWTWRGNARRVAELCGELARP
jgi:glycosyltransferase involved in cell wall biosynthesis